MIVSDVDGPWKYKAGEIQILKLYDVINIECRFSKKLTKKFCL